MHPSPLIDLHIEKTNTPLGHTKKKKNLYNTNQQEYLINFKKNAKEERYVPA